ncbi:MAG: hypothetical protein J0I49_11750 [Pseudonocardia sp.]|uniref:hypothetical protein n=1 Tax=Pseudonocardia sp. TaxID=60912 RepID=UPI001ACE552E|nr:hypothetical protein [Pseudonocardia sp.]MBN9098768.1 hypothetical protein [Pseudonocardia sp.]
MASTPHPERPPRRRPPRDEQPSVQVAMAASMLRRHRDPARVATVTGVPLALVHLIAEHLPTEPGPDTDPDTAPGRPNRSAPGDHRDDTPGEDTQFSAEDRWNEVIEPFHRRQQLQRRRIRIMRIMVICWGADTVLGAVAGLAHVAVLAAAVLILSPLIVAVLLLAAFAPHPFWASYPSSPPEPPAPRRIRPRAP